MRRSKLLISKIAISLLLVGGIALAFVGSSRSIQESGGIYTPAGPWVRSGSDIYFDDGKVGIGTTSPDVALHIGTTSPDVALHIGDDAASQISGGEDVMISGDLELAGSDLYGPATFRIGISDTERKFHWGTDTYIESGRHIKFYDDDTDATLVIIDDSGNVGIGTTSPNQLLTVEGSISLKEQADAAADTAAYGQIWVHDTAPNELWFTDDAGTDTQISPHPLDAPPGLYTVGPGIDRIDKRVQKYLGIIFWTPDGGKTVEETFEEYNARRKDEPGHRDLVKKDWNVYYERMRNKWKQEWIEENTTEKEISPEDAVEDFVDTVEDRENIVGYKTEYKLEEGEVQEVAIPVYGKKSVSKRRIKKGVRFSKKTGKFFKKVVPSDADAEKAADADFTLELPAWIKERLSP